MVENKRAVNQLIDRLPPPNHIDTVLYSPLIKDPIKGDWMYVMHVITTNGNSIVGIGDGVTLLLLRRQNVQCFKCEDMVTK